MSRATHLVERVVVMMRSPSYILELCALLLGPYLFPANAPASPRSSKRTPMARSTRGGQRRIRGRTRLTPLPASRPEQSLNRARASQKGALHIGSRKHVPQLL